jgi:hypothetical protein
MKKSLALLSIILILSSSGSALAKNGSGGSSTNTDTQAQVEAQKAAQDAAAAAAAQKAATEKAAQEASAAKAKVKADAAAKAAQAKADADATAKAVQDKAAADAAALKASQDKAAADKAAQNAAAAAKAQQAAATAAAQKAKAEKLEIQKETLELEHCGKKDSARKRIECRLGADELTLKAEFADDYKPESCIWWNNKKSDDWNNKWISECKDRYQKEQSCWPGNLFDGKNYDGKAVIDCLKPILNLPKKLSPVAEFCAGKASSCNTDYRDAVHHLIVGRFYDAENRVELWMVEGKLSSDQTTDALLWITQHKKDFYSSESKAERIAVIKSFQTNWDKVTGQL